VIICIYSGTVPSTTFIERLINGLSNSGHKIILVGKSYKEPKYSGFIYNQTYRAFSNSDKYNFYLYYKAFWSWLWLTRDNKLLINKHLKNRNFINKLKVYAVAGPLVKYNCDIFHIQWAKDTENWMFLKDLGIKIVVSLRGAQINYSPLADLKLAQIYRNNFPVVNSFHAVSMAIKNESLKYGADSNKINVIYSGLNLLDFNFKPTFKAKHDILRVISVGRPHWKKGYSLALDVFNTLKLNGVQFQYTIIGGLDEEISFQINDLNLNNEVRVLSKLKFDEVKLKIQDSDLLLLPSFEEGIANVVLEAMALGTLVLSSDCGGMIEVLDDGKNGFVFENRNKLSLENKIYEILELDISKALELINHAREKIEIQHTQSKMIDGFVNFYSQI
jgi:colanic acid/amylovoran biosynthesis glycosyltransferase